MNKKIDIYSTPSCHFCHMEKGYLTSHNIAFTDHDVASDMEKRKYIVELTGQMGVPVTVITDLDHPDQHPDVLVGFSQALFEQKLGITA
ncbi:MAG: glutaredoxin domain-containing protein [bacterium]